MPNGTTSMGLHLRYRLWIAEMNADVAVLRIFDDYLAALSPKASEPQVNEGIQHFHGLFAQFRRDSDELRHEMHLMKMQLAAISRDGKKIEDVNGLQAHMDTLKKRYYSYRKVFDAMKNDFDVFEEKWMQ